MKKLHLLLIFAGCLVLNCDAQNATIFDYLYSYDEENMPIIKIETNYKQIYKQKKKEEYQDGKFSFMGKENESFDFDIRLKSRGNMRKKVCKNPPLKIDFNKGALDSIGFDTLDKIKLVIPCRGGGSFTENLKLEHFIYELYGNIQPYRMLTKLVKFEFWQDGDMKSDMIGFIVEEEDHYAQRLDARIINKGTIRSSGFERDNFLRLCFFQYMIGNTDWSVANRHNLEIVKVPEFNMVLPIAYDFDYAGLINQPYAVPHESLPIEHVTERYFTKTKVSKKEALKTAQFFKNQKENFLATCDQATYLNEKTRKKVKKYIEEFYKTLKSEKRIIRIFSRE